MAVDPPSTPLNPAAPARIAIFPDTETVGEHVVARVEAAAAAFFPGRHPLTTLRGLVRTAGAAPMANPT